VSQPDPTGELPMTPQSRPPATALFGDARPSGFALPSHHHQGHDLFFQQKRRILGATLGRSRP